MEVHKRRNTRTKKEEEELPISSVTKRHFELQIETLQNVLRDAAKLKQIIKAKERENNEPREIDDTIRLVTEIEMLKFTTCSNSVQLEPLYPIMISRYLYFFTITDS
jgi:hypothetical protein